VPADAAAVGDREVGLDQCRQFLDDVVVHPVVLGPGLLRRIEIKARAQAEIPGAVGVIRHAWATRAGVRRDDDQTELGRHA